MWPADPPPDYLGQLDPAFQDGFAQRWADVTLEDCYFYHSVRLPDGSRVEGPWDLLDNEREYLGAIDLGGRSVLEFGPASGWLTTWMSQQGAEVVAIDLGWDLTGDIISFAGLDLEDARAQSRTLANRVENAWWYLKKAYGHSARALYAPIYDLPADIGRYDVSVLGCILLHLRDPFRALEQAAELTDDAIVVVELLNLPVADLERPIVLWNPTRGTNWSGWWSLSPGVVVDMLGAIGFTETTLSYHRQLYLPPGVPGAEQSEAVLFTVVGRRPGGTASPEG